MKYLIGEQTAARLREVLATTDGDAGGVGAPLGSRQVTFVRVTSGTPSGGFYPCVPTNRITSTGTWEDFETGRVIGANSEALTNGSRYLAVRAGDNTAGEAVFVAVVSFIYPCATPTLDGLVCTTAQE